MRAKMGSPVRNRTARSSESTRYIGMPWTRAASSAEMAGSSTPRLRSERASRTRRAKYTIAERGEYAVVGFLHRRIWQANEYQFWLTGLAGIDLDVNNRRLDSLQSG